ncbi:MAG: V-type ATP synthase subunit I [Spirochaetaceae bacterium]|jgi:V/A-type H+-transporting ATPase subunit I|nr:V-type ATP synthase subunit I [Spirochaetaceae bacterium]
MIRPEKMKQIEITVLERDVDSVITYLGRNAILQFTYSGVPAKERGMEDKEVVKRRVDSLDKIKRCAHYLDVELPQVPGENTAGAADAEDAAFIPIFNAVSALEQEEYDIKLEKQRAEEQLNTLSGFEVIPDSMAESGGFSFVNLKIGRLDPQRQGELKQHLGERAVVVPLGGESREVVIASSKKGRFSLDSELKKQEFSPANLPKDSSAPASVTVNQIKVRLAELPAELSRIEARKKAYRETFGPSLQSLCSSYIMAELIAEIKSRLVATKNTRVLTGWLPARAVQRFVNDLVSITEGRVAVSSKEPWEVPGVRSGAEKIPIRLRNGRFAKGFEPLVFSYGAPAYGAIDPTPITAFFFTLLFAIMFGDVGQGFVILMLGLLAANKKIAFFDKYRHFTGPLKSIGLASMITGLLYGSVFSNEELLHKPTEFITGAISQTALGEALGIEPVEKILIMMPSAGNMEKIFYFFGFTIAIGVILNSIGLIINIMNKLALRNYDSALFSKTGVAGLAFFWYAISLAVRAIIRRADFRFAALDAVCLAVPVFFIVFGHTILRIFSGKRPVFKEGIFAFVIEGIVEIIETFSGYISNTVSFLRVGAFALSHAVLSFIIWTMAEKVGEAPLGSLWGLFIVIFGNFIIILLEGMIVAIQVTRLQYYEFFSKFFTDTGTVFSPFTFKDPSLQKKEKS